MSDTLQLLIVDDEEKMRLGMARALREFRVELPELDRQATFVLHEADSGEAALALIERQPVDVVLLDHKLPGMQGLDVLRLLTEQRRDLVIVMVTAYASIATAVSAGKQGAFDFLAKPFTPKELKDTVAKAVVYLLTQRQARQLEQERRQVRFQFISVVAHELKSPINAINSYLQVLLDPAVTVEPERVRFMLERSQVRLEGMRKLVADLLDLTRIESGQRQRQVAPVDLTDVARRALDSAGQAAQEHQITLALAAPATPIMMAADPAELEIVLNNLVSNAIKYNRPNGRVDVTLTATDAVATVRVADTGIGMSADELARLFGEFVRIKNPKTRGILGSGLGLSIVKRLCKLYGGEVAVESTPDVGTAFTVTLSRQGATGTASTATGTTTVALPPTALAPPPATAQPSGGDPKQTPA